MLKQQKKEKFQNDFYHYRYLFIAIFLLFPIFLCHIDNDTWFILNTGREIVTHGFITIEPFSIHKGLDFLPQQWLFSVFIYKCYTIGGLRFVQTIMIFLCMALLLCIYKLAMIISEKNISVSIFSTILVAFILLTFYTVRPFMVSALILTIELILLEKYTIKNEIKYLVGIPFLSILLINTHASMWMMMFVMALPYIAGRIPFHQLHMKNGSYKILPILIALFISIFCGFINPYRLEAMTYVFRSYGVKDISNNIIEMLPLSISSYIGIIVLIAIVIFFIVWEVQTSKDKTVETRYMFLFLGTFLMALLNIRSAILFSLGIVSILAALCRSKKSNNLLIIEPLKKPQKITIYILLCTICIFSIYTIKTKSINTPKVQQASKKLESIIKDKKHTKIYTGYEEGGYLQFYGMHTYIDARAEVYIKSNNHKKDIFHEYINLIDGNIYYKDFLKIYNFDYLVTKQSDLLVKDLNYDQNYKKIYSDKYYIVWRQIRKEQ